MLIKHNIKLSDIESPYHGILCSNKNEAIKLCKAMHELGYKWCDDHPYINRYNWHNHTNFIIYFPFDGTYDDTMYYDNDPSYTITPFKQILLC